MSERTICIPERAVPKGRPRVGKHVYTPARTKAWEERVAWAWRMAHRFTEPYTGRLELIIEFNFAKRAYAADTDNLVKSCSDALEGLAYDNDRQIDHIDAWRRKAERDSVTITVRELGEKTETAEELRASRTRLREYIHTKRIATVAWGRWIKVRDNAELLEEADRTNQIHARASRAAFDHGDLEDV